MEDNGAESSGQSTSPSGELPDMEDVGRRSGRPAPARPTVTKRKLGQQQSDHRDSQHSDVQLTKSWREALGEAPTLGTTKVRGPHRSPTGQLLWCSSIKCPDPNPPGR